MNESATSEFISAIIYRDAKASGSQATSGCKATSTFAGGAQGKREVQGVALASLIRPTRRYL